MPNYKIETEKRQLFVLDLPVGASEREFPHVIVPVGKGVVFVFIKQTIMGWRFVVGQEDVIEGNSKPAPENNFQSLLDAGLKTIMPFLEKAKVETVLWGFDATNKTLKLEQNDNLYAANCGSAIRSCVYLGEAIAKTLLK